MKAQTRLVRLQAPCPNDLLRFFAAKFALEDARVFECFALSATQPAMEAMSTRHARPSQTCV